MAIEFENEADAIKRLKEFLQTDVARLGNGYQSGNILVVGSSRLDSDPSAIAKDVVADFNRTGTQCKVLETGRYTQLESFRKKYTKS